MVLICEFQNSSQKKKCSNNGNCKRSCCESSPLSSCHLVLSSYHGLLLYALDYQTAAKQSSGDLGLLLVKSSFELLFLLLLVLFFLFYLLAKVSKNVTLPETHHILNYFDICCVCARRCAVKFNMANKHAYVNDLACTTFDLSCNMIVQLAASGILLHKTLPSQREPDVALVSSVLAVLGAIASGLSEMRLEFGFWQ